jgi:hypothetical protein
MSYARSDRIWPKADRNFTQFLPIWIAAFGKSGLSNSY